MIRRPPGFTPFPNTTLSRSRMIFTSIPAVPPCRHAHRPSGALAAAVLAAAALLIAGCGGGSAAPARDRLGVVDRKSTRLNSSHANISYAVFCLKKNKHRLYQ